MKQEVKLRFAYAAFAYVGAGILVAAFLIPFSQGARAYEPVNSEIEFGSRGADVSALQTFLASDAATYPEGLVTGYFGSLTRDAVVRFQMEYGIPAVGRVGPLTLAKLNALISANMGIDVRGPAITDAKLTVSGQQATASWNTNELAKAKVFYDTKPLVMLEAQSPQTEPVISGSVQSDQSLTLSKQISLTGLSSSTTYYYVLEAIDAQGNVSVGAQQTFTTQ